MVLQPLSFVTLVFLVTMVDWICIVNLDLTDFFKINFSLCIFVRNITLVILCPCLCISSGGTWCQFVSLLVMLPKSVTARWQGCIGHGVWERAHQSALRHPFHIFTNLEAPIYLFIHSLVDGHLCW